MTLEQAHAYDNSVVVKSGGGVDMSVPPQNHNVKAILIDETFDTGLPASWFQVQYSGSNLWGWVPGIPTFSSYDPPNTDGNFACANGYNYGAHDVGLFTHSMDMSAAAGPDVFINVDTQHVGDIIQEFQWCIDQPPAEIDDLLDDIVAHLAVRHTDSRGD